MTAYTTRAVQSFISRTMRDGYVQKINTIDDNIFLAIGRELIKVGELVIAFDAGSKVPKLLVSENESDIDKFMEIDSFVFDGDNITGLVFPVQSPLICLIYSNAQGTSYPLAVKKMGEIKKADMVGIYLTNTLGTK